MYTRAYTHLARGEQRRGCVHARVCVVFIDVIDFTANEQKQKSETKLQRLISM